MKGILAALALGIASAAAPAYAADDSWLIGRLGDDTCVPMEDIGFDHGHLVRLDGFGHFHTPESYIDFLREAGLKISRVKEYQGRQFPNNVEIYHSTTPRFSGYFFFFTDEAVCSVVTDIMKNDN